MMRRLILSATMAVTVLSAFAWGQKGHDVTACIAEHHLTPTAKAAVDSILDGRSMVYWSNWLDNASHTPEYAYTKTWHYKNIDKGVRYEEAPANPAGDAVVAIKAQLETLGNPSATPEESALAMKILVHLLGDMHMPLHMGHATDLGGNRNRLRFFGRDTNLHSIWDSSIPESAHKWSYSEWQEQVDRADEADVQSITAGSVDDWAKETVNLATAVYTYFDQKDNVSYDEVAYWAPTVELQFLRGGLRLAHLLNMIYDPAYRAAME